jgi:pyruvate,water dikinase
MRKVSAIVTDLGGITCHAAIVCRELKIPAVVGVGQATDRLRTGDKIRVDADKGEIEILK